MKKLAILLLLSSVVLASYSNDKGEDHPIVGKWECVKTIQPDGSEVVDLIATEHYYSDGTLLFVNLWLSPQPVEEFTNTPEEINKNLQTAYGAMCTYTIEKGEDKDRLTYVFVNSTRTKDMGTSHSVDISVNGDTLIFYFNGKQLIMKRSEPDTSTVANSSIGSIENQDISIFPNPANTLLTIDTRSNGPHHAEIVSMNGQMVYSRRFESTTHQIDLSSFPEGIYILTINSQDQMSIKKVLKL